MLARPLKRLLLWLILPLQCAMGVVPASGLLICVGPGHFDIEAPHAGIPCHSSSHDEAPKGGCVDVPIVGAPVDRPTVQALSIAPPALLLAASQLVSLNGGGLVDTRFLRVSIPPEEQALAALRTVVLLT